MPSTFFRLGETNMSVTPERLKMLLKTAVNGNGKVMPAKEKKELREAIR